RRQRRQRGSLAVHAQGKCTAVNFNFGVLERIECDFDDQVVLGNEHLSFTRKAVDHEFGANLGLSGPVAHIVLGGFFLGLRAFGESQRRGTGQENPSHASRITPEWHTAHSRWGGGIVTAYSTEIQ